MDIKHNKLPMYWKNVKDFNDLRQLSSKSLKENKRKKQLEEKRLLKETDRIIEIKHQYNEDKSKLTQEEIEFWENLKYDPELTSPMDKVCECTFQCVEKYVHTIKINDLIVPIDEENKVNTQTKYVHCKKVEGLIEKYSLKLKDMVADPNYNADDSLILSDDFEKLIEDIRKVYISKNYKMLMLWLIYRAFNIRAKGRNETLLNKNRPILLKTLWTVNKPLFLSCFN